MVTDRYGSASSQLASVFHVMRLGGDTTVHLSARALIFASSLKFRNSKAFERLSRGT